MTTAGYVEPPFVDYFIGLDLGKTNDYTAYALLERSGTKGAYRYDVTGVERTRGRMYPDVIRMVQELTADPALRPRRLIPADARGPERIEPAPPPTLVADSSGVGEPITDILLTTPLAATAVPVKITGGDTWRRDRWPGTTHTTAYWVAKRLLCANVLALLAGGRLRVIPTLPDARVLEDELRKFKIDLTKYGNETFGCWRDGEHDDTVLAVALACWYAELRPVVRRIVVGAHPFSGYRG